MAFRDDREALRAKNEVLEDQVSELERLLARAEERLEAQEAEDADDERELAALREEVADLRKRLGIAPPKPANPAEVKWMVMAGLGMALLAGVGFGVFTTVSEGDEEDGLERVHPPGTVEVEDESDPDPESPPPPPPIRDAAYFGAVVVAAEGMNTTVGEGCVLEVEIGEAPRRVLLTCAAPVHTATLARSVLMFDAGEGEVVDGYALRASHASLMIDTPRREILVEPEAGVFTRLYVDAFGIASTDAEPPDDAVPYEEAEANPEIEALLAVVESEATCEVSGRFDGRMRTSEGVEARVSLRASGMSLERTLVGGRVVENVERTRRQLNTPLGEVSGAVELDCERRIAVIEEGDRRASARLGPGYVSLVGVFEAGEETGTFWMRRTGPDPEPAEVGVEVEANSETTTDIANLPPHVQEAVRRALEQQQR